jgi:DNA mismatch repair protein MutS
MKETASILREADAKSFVLIDEIGRGTSTTDGLAIARAVLEHLHDHTRALCIFATHYHELSEDAERLANVFNASMGIREWEGELVFLRKLVREAAHSSYGLYVAQWAGLPSKLLARAEKELKKLQAPQMTKRSQVAEANQISLFGVLNDDSKVQKLSQENEKLKLELRKKQEVYELLRKDLRDLLLKLDEAQSHSP